MRKFLVLGGVLLTLAGVPLGASPASAATPWSTCLGKAWPRISDVAHANAFFPDTNATYWLSPYALGAGDALVVKGQRPDARYSSLTTYTLWGSPIEHVTDDQLAAKAGDPYTEVVSTAVAPGQGVPGTIAAGTQPGAALGWVALRIYLATNPADPKGGEALPTLVRRAADGKETPLTPCPDPTGSAPTGGLQIPALDSSTVTFKRFAAGFGFPNLDNAYISAGVKAEPGRVVVMEGKAPTFPDTRDGQPITGHEDLRYWSVCTNARRLPFPVTACAADYTLPLDAHGDYHVVVSRAADKPATLAPGSVWLPWDDTSDLQLILRNMLPAAGFTHAAQDVPKGSDDLSAMGDYAPHATLTTTAAYAHDVRGLA